MVEERTDPRDCLSSKRLVVSEQENNHIIDLHIIRSTRTGLKSYLCVSPWHVPAREWGVVGTGHSRGFERSREGGGVRDRPLVTS